MPQHYPKNTFEVSYWCNTCNRKTMHAVFNGRLGACKNDHHKDKKPESKTEQASLFEERP